MSVRFWFVAGWKYTSTKGRIILGFGFVSLMIICIGAVFMFIGVIGLFTIIGASHPNTDMILQLLFSGFLFMCGGAVGMVIYLIGMSFIPPPVLPDKENNN